MATETLVAQETATPETPATAPAEAPATPEGPAETEPPVAEEPASDETAPEESTAPEPEATEEPVAPAEETPAADEAEPAEPAAEEESDEAVTEEDPAEEPAAEGTDWAGLMERAPAFIAVMHHAAVHMPIALWLLGAFFVLVGVVAPSWRNQIPMACLLGGTATSIFAAASGWWYAAENWGDWNWGDDFTFAEHLDKHRWTGVMLVIASLVLSVLALISQAKKGKAKKLAIFWRLGLLALAAAVAWEGHIGGEMIHGEGFLEEAYDVWINSEE